VDPQQPIIYQAEPVESDDTELLPPPDPKLFGTYDGSNGKGTPGTGGGAYARGTAKAAKKVKDALD